ncbi:MAG TPA: amidohydrolase family protein [Verrucomicrobiae bacterium]|jgi:cytosine/adenosine deaminase-related metal-dependent hydrolase
MLLRAHTVLPICREPIHDGAVLVHGNRIAAVGPWADLRAQSTDEVVDLGEVALLPGLINAHCHLDYTGMAGLIPAPRHFTDWIKSIIALKAEWSFSEFAASWVNGAEQLLRSGTTTVADIEAVPELLPEVWNATPLRVHSFLEMINVRSRTPGHELVAQATERIRALPAGNKRAGLSPHAPYSASADVFTAARQAAWAEGWLVTSHVAESAAEFDMFMYRHGELFDWLRSQRATDDCGRGSPIAHLERLEVLGPQFLAVHVNFLGNLDASQLGRHRVSVVHCPRSHAYFGHQPFPRQALTDAGVNICLGTDSLASMLKDHGRVPTLSMFAEMQAMAAADNTPAPVKLLRLATMAGAHALGRAGELGELSPEALADLIAVPLGSATKDAVEAVVFHQGAVAASMIDGQWAVPPKQ